MGIKIIGTGSYLPEKILTNSDLEKMVNTNNEWIRTRTGISERRVALDDQATVYMGTKAAERALDMAKLNANEIDLIIYGTITPDFQLPANACLVQKQLKAESSACFDIQAACTGFIYALEIASAMLQTKKSYKNILIIGGEKLSSVTNWKDRNTCVLFGDAAGAAILTKTDDKKNTILSCNIHAAGKHSDLLMIPGGGSLNPLTRDNIGDKTQYIKMTGNAVLKLAVRTMVKSSEEALANANVSKDEIKWLIPHQANIRIMNAVASRLEFGRERVSINLNKYGNTSAASIMLSLDEYVRNGKIVEGDKLLLTAFGGGATWGSAVLEW